MQPEFSKEDFGAKISANLKEADADHFEARIEALREVNAGQGMRINHLEGIVARLHQENEVLKKSASKDTPLMEQLKEWGDMFVHIGTMSDEEFEKVGLDAETAELITKTEAICKGVERILTIVEKTGLVERILVTYRKYFEFIVRAIKRSKLDGIVRTMQNLFKGKGKK